MSASSPASEPVDLNANLTRSGVWLFAAAMIATATGVASGEIFVVLFGAALVLAVAVAYGLAIPGALVLDRRFVEARVQEASSAAAGGHSGHVVGDEVEASFVLDNSGSVPLFGLDLGPYGPAELTFEGDLAVGGIPAGRSVSTHLEVRAERSGRWMLQGFDVSVTDPFGLVEARDYIPCNFAFEFYPNVGRLARSARDRRVEQQPRKRREGRKRATLTSGTEVRELREYESGDPLRHIAWKASARLRKLISRDFENEIATATTVLLDISGSMRGGAWKGQKLEHAVELTAGLADELIGQRNRVGVISFDEKVYGYVPPGASRKHYHRILHHLLGLSSIVDPELTELDDAELRELLVDYLLVQERLDFRKGNADGAVNGSLLRRWVRSRLEEERELYHSPALREGVVTDDQSPIREFVQLRGLPVPYRVESRLGPKGRGMAEAFERVAREAKQSRQIVAVSDLCGVSNFEVLDRALALVRREGHRVRFVVPFTPAYYFERREPSEKRDILLELFTVSEREERLRGVRFLEKRGVDVQFVGSNRRSDGRAVSERPAAE